MLWVPGLMITVSAAVGTALLLQLPAVLQRPPADGPMYSTSAAFAVRGNASSAVLAERTAASLCNGYVRIKLSCIVQGATNVGCLGPPTFLGAGSAGSVQIVWELASCWGFNADPAKQDAMG